MTPEEEIASLKLSLQLAERVIRLNEIIVERQQIRIESLEIEIKGLKRLRVESEKVVRHTSVEDSSIF